MALDTRIPLMGNPVQPVNFWDVMQGAQQLAKQTHELRQAQRAEQDEMALREALQQHQEDPDAAVTALVRSGHGPVALKLSTLLQEQRKKAADALKVQLDNDTAALSLGTQIANSITDESTFQLGRRMLQTLSPQVAAAMGDAYDPARIEQLKIAGMKASEYNTARKQAFDEWESVRDFEADAPKRLDAARKALGTFLSTAETPEQWQAFMGGARDVGIPASVVSLFPREWNPDAPKKAAELTMTPEERATLSGQEAARTETARHNKVMEGLARAGLALRQAEFKAGSAVSSNDIPAEYANALDRAILNIPAVRRPAVVNLANRLAKEGKLDELKDVIRLAAIETENVDTKNQVVGRMATLASIRDTRDILNEMQQKGVPTNYFTGTIEDMARKLGTSTNPEYVTLSNRLMGTLINYRRAATGVQFGQREAADYQRMFPNYRNTLPVNLALIEGLEREMETYDRTYWTHKLGESGARLVIGDAMGGTPTPAAQDTSGAQQRKPNYRFNPKTGKLEKVP